MLPFSTALLIIWGLLFSVKLLQWVAVTDQVIGLVLFLWVVVAIVEYAFNLASPHLAFLKRGN